MVLKIQVELVRLKGLMYKSDRSSGSGGSGELGGSQEIHVYVCFHK